MPEPIQAIYENGVFKPLVALNLPEHQAVRITVETTSAESVSPDNSGSNDPLAGIRTTTGIPDLAENFDDYRFGKRRP